MRTLAAIEIFNNPNLQHAQLRSLASPCVGETSYLKASRNRPLGVQEMNGLVQQPAQDLKCWQIAPEVVLLVAKGRVTRHSMSTLLPTFQDILSRMKQPGWIIDTSELDDFEPAAVGVGTDWFRSFKAGGGKKVIFVSGHATARMAAMTISFAARVPLEACLTLAEACDLLGVTHPPTRATGTSGTRAKFTRG